mmetsp:Transcript_11007/g.32030  ORF Transcript_11007/g.32030 Transcript_11007/m.32030 type:complete len:370 (-) Transcript_11007:622-1731(-)
MPAAICRAPVVLQNPGVSLRSHFGTLSFSTGRGGTTSHRTLVTVDVLGLVKALTTKSDEQRCEWARHLMLQASQARSDSQLHNLYSSIERDGWAAYRSRRQADEDSHGAQGSQSRIPAKHAEERKVIAEELRAYASELRAALRRSASASGSARKPDAMAAATTSKALTRAPAVATSDASEDVLRSGVRNGVASAPMRSVPIGPSDVGMMRRPSIIKRRGNGFTGDTHAVLLASPRWENGSVPGRVQAILRFEAPGIGAGDSVLVLGPGGERLPLVVPSGMLHIQRAVVSLSQDPQEAREYALRLDITTLGRKTTPGDVVSVNGVPLWLPQFAAPATSLVVGLPLVAGEGDSPTSPFSNSRMQVMHSRDS